MQILFLNGTSHTDSLDQCEHLWRDAKQLGKSILDTGINMISRRC